VVELRNAVIAGVSDHGETAELTLTDRKSACLEIDEARVF